MVTCEMLAPTSKLLFDNIPLSQASISQNLYFPQPHRYFSAHSGAVVKSAFSQRGGHNNEECLTQPETFHRPQNRDNFQVQVHYHFQRCVFWDGQPPSKKVR